MAVRVQFISVIIPIEQIDRSSIPGGFSGLLESEGDNVGKLVWHDDHLFAECAMNPFDVQAIVERWESRGLTARVGTDDSRYWKDLCVVDFYQGPTLPCRWIQFDPREHVVWHKKSPRGTVVDPSVKHEDNPTMLTPEMMKSAQVSTDTKKPWWKFW